MILIMAYQLWQVSLYFASLLSFGSLANSMQLKVELTSL